MLLGRGRLGTRVLTLMLVAAVSLAVGCGGSEDEPAGNDGVAAQQSSGDEREIREKVALVGKAMQRRDTETVCAELVARVREQMKKLEGYPTCAQGLHDALTDDPTGKPTAIEPGAPRITAVRVRGQRAVVEGTRNGQPRRAMLQREGGAWRFASWFTGE